MEKEILKVIAILAEDPIYRQVYAKEIKMLFNMLSREQEQNLECGSFEEIPQFKGTMEQLDKLKII
jgi:hypothetical protein